MSLKNVYEIINALQEFYESRGGSWRMGEWGEKSQPMCGNYIKLTISAGCGNMVDEQE